MSAGGRSRAAALTLLAGVVVVAGAAILVPAALYWSNTGAEIREARLKTLRAEQRAEARLALQNSQAEWERFAAGETSGFVAAQSDALVLMAIRDRIATAFTSLGGTISSVEGEAEDGPRKGTRRMRIDVRGTLGKDRLGPLLTALESTPPFVIIEKFDASRASDNELGIRITGSVFQLVEAGS